MYTLNFTLLVFWDHWTESLTIRTVADNDMSFDYNGVLCVCHQDKGTASAMTHHAPARALQ